MADQAHRDHLKELRSLLDNFRKHLVDQFDPRGALTFDHAPPLILLLVSFVHTILHRINDLSTVAYETLVERKLIPSGVLVRAVGETVALLHATFVETNAARTPAGLSELSKRLEPLILGTRRKSQKIRPPNVLDLVDKTDKVLPGFRSHYDELSEVAHPNLSGNYAYYKPDFRLDTGSLIGTPSAEREKLLSGLILNFFSTSIRLANGLTKDLMVLLPTLVRRLDNLPLLYQIRSIEHHKEVIAAVSREDQPLLWASAHHALGDALFRIGEREEGTDRIREAVSAHRAALSVFTKDCHPVEWANSQRCLGGVLIELGERDQNVAVLMDAIRAEREALQVWKRNRFPELWAQAVFNIGAAQAAVADIAGSLETLAEAEASYRDALGAVTMESAPVTWAGIQNNLGALYLVRGRWTDQVEDFQRAFAAYQTAQRIYTKKNMPVDWAMSELSVSLCHLELGERTDSNERLRAALEGARAVLEVCPIEENFEMWRKAQGVCAEALGHLLISDNAVTMEELRLFSQSLGISDRAPLTEAAMELVELTRSESAASELAKAVTKIGNLLVGPKQGDSPD